MADSAGYLFSKDEIEKACALIENHFGTDYFRQGTEVLKDSDPSGSGLGRRNNAGCASRLLLAWYRSTEELAYAELSGIFKPGIHSAVIGILGKSLRDLRSVPGLDAAARGLLDDSIFDRTVMALSVAAGFRRLYEKLCFPANGADYFFVGNKYAVICLKPKIPHPHPGKPLHPLQGDLLYMIKSSVMTLLPGLRPSPAHLKQLFYIDTSELPLPLAEIGNLLAEAPAGFLDCPGSETAAIVLFKTEFSRGAEGVCPITSSLPVINKKTSGPILTEGPGIYLP